MRYSHMAAHHASLEAEAAELDGKKRLGKNQKTRRAAIADELGTQPPPTPRRAPTGERADFQGNVYEMRRTDGQHHSLRDMRRLKASGKGSIKFMRSRIQRSRRKQRTGGVR